MTLFEKNLGVEQPGLFMGVPGDERVANDPAKMYGLSIIPDTVDLSKFTPAMLEFDPGTSDVDTASYLYNAPVEMIGLDPYDESGYLESPNSFNGAVNYLDISKKGKIFLSGYVHIIYYPRGPNGPRKENEQDFMICNWYEKPGTDAIANAMRALRPTIYLMREFRLPDWIKYDSKRRFREMELRP